MIRIVTEVAGADRAVNELPISPIAYGLLAFTALVGLLLVAFAFRSVGTRH